MADTDPPDELTTLRAAIDDVDDRILVLLNERARTVIRVGEVKAASKSEFYVPLSELYVPAKSISGVFDDVARGQAEFGVVPIENSTEGVVNHTLDMFMESELGICAEILLEVSHHLLSRAPSLAAVQKIYSHPQALAQCRAWLDANARGLPVIEVASTALAAQMAADDESAAAIASELAAQLYELRVLKSKIEDNLANFTRFLVISTRKVKASGSDKTSLMFALKDEPGILYRALRPFDAHKVNMTKIESRPSKKKPWEYIFFIDLDGHVDSETVQASIDALRASCLVVKVLGSYPRARTA